MVTSHTALSSDSASKGSSDAGHLPLFNRILVWADRPLIALHVAPHAFVIALFITVVVIVVMTISQVVACCPVSSSAAAAAAALLLLPRKIDVTRPADLA